MARTSAITSAPVSPADDLRRRFIMYTTTMSIRVACVLGCFFVTGIWQIVCIVGAVVLPYIAVVIANVSRAPRREAPEAPGPLEIPRSWPE